MFGDTELDYLGYRIDGENTKPMTKHLTQISNLAPLTDLLKNNNYKGTAVSEIAFNKLQEDFTKPITLARPKPGPPYILQTDPSGKGIAAILYTMPNSPRWNTSHHQSRQHKALIHAAKISYKRTGVFIVNMIRKTLPKICRTNTLHCKNRLKRSVLVTTV